ncbi:hypothetical protein V6N12_000723 [Hibiscus sabdariffa]|uniref:Transferrin-like domain-containing protein n=1 Tax=Hibiscus sabdariffa TaxID=183260 RepID=A0ABR2BX80_9ROSI
MAVMVNGRFENLRFELVKKGEVLVRGCRYLVRGLMRWPWCSMKDGMGVGRWCAVSDDERLKVSQMMGKGT